MKFNKMENKILNSLSPKKFMGFDRLEKIADPKNDSKYVSTAFSCGLTRLRRDGFIIRKDIAPNAGYNHYVFRRATEAEVKSFTETRNNNTRELRDVLTERYKYRATLEKSVGLTTGEFFSALQNIHNVNSAVQVETCNGDRGSKYRLRTVDERVRHMEFKNRILEDTREVDRRHAFSEEKSRWKRLVEIDAVSIGWQKLKKMIEIGDLRFDRTSGKWWVPGANVMFDISVGRTIKFTTSEATVEVTNLYKVVEVVKQLGALKEAFETLSKNSKLITKGYGLPSRTKTHWNITKLGDRFVVKSDQYDWTWKESA